jgi:uncharacterized membrane protein
MEKTRLEAFSDGVIAIIITIMVLELKPPHDVKNFSDLGPLLPIFLSYVLSFVMILIYWNNHHHLFRPVKHINGNILLANGLLLFWLSLAPFVTNIMGESHFASFPVLLYGINMMLCGVAYYILGQLLIRIQGKDSTLGKAIGTDRKGITSLLMYIAGCVISPFAPIISCLIYAAVAVMWLIPDKRIEQRIQPDEEG